MPLIVRDLPPLKLTTTSTAVATQPTNAIGMLDDANNITFFLASSASALTSSVVVQISQFDPTNELTSIGRSQNPQWNNTTFFTFSSSGQTFTITNISFRGIRLQVAASGNSAELNEPCVYVCKQISV